MYIKCDVRYRAVCSINFDTNCDWTSGFERSLESFNPIAHSQLLEERFFDSLRWNFRYSDIESKQMEGVKIRRSWPDFFEISHPRFIYVKNDLDEHHSVFSLKANLLRTCYIRLSLEAWYWHRYLFNRLGCIVCWISSRSCLSLNYTFVRKFFTLVDLADLKDLCCDGMCIPDSQNTTHLQRGRLGQTHISHFQVLQRSCVHNAL